jgi:hypothetical protein
MIDLHMHSTFSDGTFTPTELVARAEEKGLTAMALTDHDSTNGIGELLAAAGDCSVTAVPGVEISADFRPGTMHILGYYVAHEDLQLNDHLRWIRQGREARNREILHKLVALGCHISWEEVAHYAGEDVVGRPHFARALVERGYVKDTREAFHRYLARGKPAYADRRRLSPEDSISLIRQAGGVAVLAHPYTLHLGKWDLRRQVRKMCEMGLEGIEVFYSDHTRPMQKQYLHLARDYDLLVTGGSDFHGAGSPDIDVGSGFGNLEVHDELFKKLEARAATKAVP